MGVAAIVAMSLPQRRWWGTDYEQEHPISPLLFVARPTLAGILHLRESQFWVSYCRHQCPHSSGKPLVCFLLLFVLLSLFSSEKSKIMESIDYLRKANPFTFHVLFVRFFITTLLSTQPYFFHTSYIFGVYFDALVSPPLTALHLTTTNHFALHHLNTTHYLPMPERCRWCCYRE